MIVLGFLIYLHENFFYVIKISNGVEEKTILSISLRDPKFD